jgi:hypothetical protein
MPDYLFKIGSQWSELPGGSLLITGGDPYEDNLEPDEVTTIAREVAKIDTLREFAVCSVPPMHSARSEHAAVYHSQYLYVLGGYFANSLEENFMSECERFVLAESRWEVLPALPVGGCNMRTVELDNCLYALGGGTGHLTLDTVQKLGLNLDSLQKLSLSLDTVQKLSLNSLTWELMQLKLPEGTCEFPCFKIDTQAYLIIDKTLYSFTALQIELIKPLPKFIKCLTSYYSRGTLYYDYFDRVDSFELEELIN